MSGTVQFMHIATLVLLFIGLRRTDDLVPWIAAAVIAVMGMSFFISEGGQGNENFQAEFLLIATAFFYRRYKWLAIAVVGYMLVIQPSNLEFVVLGLIVALILLSFAREWPVGTVAAVIMAGCFGVLVWLMEPLTISLLSRAELAINTGAMWFAAPIKGHGLGSFNYVYPAFAEADLRLLPWKEWSVLGDAHVHPGAAHNEYLQVLSELGLIGGLIAAAFFGLMVRLPAPLMVTLVLCLTGFPLQNPATGVLAVIAIGQAMKWREPTFKVPILVAVVAAIFAFSSTKSIIAQQVFQDVGKSLKLNPAVAMQANIRAYEIYPADLEIRLQYFRTLVRAAQFYENLTIDPRAAEIAYEISRSAIPENPGLLLARRGFLKANGKCGRECDQIRDILRSQSSRSWELRDLK